MSAADWTPVADPASPDDFHTWAVPPCPDCSCCTARLCHTARERGTVCVAAGVNGPGSMDVTGCPCTDGSAR